MLNEINDFMDKIGAGNIQDPGLTIEKIAQWTGQELEEMGLAELENLMITIASYNVYLKSQRSMLESKLSVLKARLSYLLGLQTQIIQQKFMSKEEKEAFALSQNAGLMSLRKECLDIEAKLLRLKDLPFSIDKELDMIKLKYTRRRDEVNESKFESRHTN
jgi:hypothetical protein